MSLHSQNFLGLRKFLGCFQRHFLTSRKSKLWFVHDYILLGEWLPEFFVLSFCSLFLFSSMIFALCTKRKIVHDCEPSNINLVDFVCFFEVCWASVLFLSVNCGLCSFLTLFPYDFHRIFRPLFSNKFGWLCNSRRYCHTGYDGIFGLLLGQADICFWINSDLVVLFQFCLRKGVPLGFSRNDHNYLYGRQWSNVRRTFGKL